MSIVETISDAQLEADGFGHKRPERLLVPEGRDGETATVAAAVYWFAGFRFFAAGAYRDESSAQRCASRMADAGHRPFVIVRSQDTHDLPVFVVYLVEADG